MFWHYAHSIRWKTPYQQMLIEGFERITDETNRQTSVTNQEWVFRWEKVSMSVTRYWYGWRSE